MSSVIMSPSDLFSFRAEVDDDIGFNPFEKSSKKKKATSPKRKISPIKRKKVVKVTKKKLSLKTKTADKKGKKASPNVIDVTDLEDDEIEIIGNQKNEKNVSDNAPKAHSQTGKKSVEQIYQKKSQLEHILLRPDTYSEYSKNEM